MCSTPLVKTHHVILTKGSDVYMLIAFVLLVGRRARVLLLDHPTSVRACQRHFVLFPSTQVA